MSPAPRRPARLQPKYLGELFWMDDFIPPSDTFPAFCLASAEQLLAETNWPDLVPYLRDKPIRYDPTGKNLTVFSVKAWSIDSEGAALYFVDKEPEQRVAAALAEDQRTQRGGGTPAAICMTVTQPVGPIAPGEYSVSAVTDDGPAHVRFPYPGALSPLESIPAVAALEFYRHRVPGKAAVALHVPIRERVFLVPGGPQADAIGGLRRDDRIQEHRHPTGRHQHSLSAPTLKQGAYVAGWVGGTRLWEPNPTATALAYATSENDPEVREVEHGHETRNGVVVRVGSITEPRSVGMFPYIFGERYVP